MARKLKLNPKVSYILGLYSYNKVKGVGIVTTNNEIISIFVKTVLDEFKIEPNKILIEQEEKAITVYFYNSKIKKLMNNALERRDKLFKYRNAYSANYFAGIFDVIGGRDPKGLYLRDLDNRDAQLLEFLNFHTEARGSKTYIMNENTFASFIKEFSQTVR